MSIRNLLILCAVFMFALQVDKSRAEVSISASVGVNFSELDNYGEWVHVEGLGRVWRPDADAGWRPFTYGHWVYSNDGWLWNSDEPFGWIVCHYGNWYEDDDYGWVWVPGYDWSPARVDWYVTDNEIAWAPLYPQNFRHRFHRVHWAYCPIGIFGTADIHSHIHFDFRPERPDVHVRVYAGPPRIDFVQHRGNTTVIRVTPRKVEVRREHPLFKVEFDGDRHHSDVVVPIGRQYRRGHVHEEARPVVEIQSHGDDAHSTARPIEHDRPQVIVEPRREEHGHDARVVVEPQRRVIIESHSDQSEHTAKVEVRRRGNDNDNDNNDDQNNRGKKRVRVEVHGN
jgi:hypothetical protein